MVKTLQGQISRINLPDIIKVAEAAKLDIATVEAVYKAIEATPVPEAKLSE